MSLRRGRGGQTDRQKLEGADRREICLAQGHSQGLLFRITSRKCIKSEKLTFCGKKDRNLHCSELCNTSHL